MTRKKTVRKEDSQEDRYIEAKHLFDLGWDLAHGVWMQRAKCQAAHIADDVARGDLCGVQGSPGANLGGWRMVLRCRR
ncbi:MAG: hypothetical protein A2289_11725 [Deltaproteobacteria bacterium RIFOXYA12_FULL_58_15]|nr:MAG: hypothetical protein A2289_11725 [Deltaproteobacteria bacterium RIFOXYA12_FULL_58_15]OGR11137.1 MAG: hypothetical protein A2341_12150 [Deltaproteobacteria bacterium RIFOXYB12_FULL_58_9]